MGFASQQELRHAEGVLGFGNHEHHLVLFHIRPRCLPTPPRKQNCCAHQGGSTIKAQQRTRSLSIRLKDRVKEEL